MSSRRDVFPHVYNTLPILNTMGEELLKRLLWRYATKKFDAAKNISEHDLRELLEVLRLAPSSFGLQPWKFLVISNAELRKKLREHAWNQAQITDASHLVVLCARTDVDESFVLCALGYRSKDDKYAAAAKVRFNREDVFVFHT